jgi:hypothetical protein
MGRHRIVKKKMPSTDEIIQHFVDSRSNPVYKGGTKIFEGDIFYSDISYYIHNVLKAKGPWATNMFMDVCNGLRARKFWVHS